LGQYEVQDFIGQGAMGLVYRAYHPHLQRTGAVKVMQAIAPDPDAVARFRHEAQAIAQMRHPNILNVYDFGEHQGTPYMIVEYVPGGSLADRLGRGPLDHSTSLKYLRGIAAGLDYAHSMGVVHRDVKPANVLLTMDDTPVLADFGLAKLLQGSSLKSMTGVTTGTPAYMAPEQVMGSHVGPPADRYALATIAYEMTTGFIPFDGQALLELLYAQVHRYPDPPSARNHSLSPEVDAVIMRGLAKDPAMRWASCADFVEALQAALMDHAPETNARTVVMKPPSALVDLAPPAAGAPQAPASISAPAVLAPADGASVAVASSGPPSAPPGPQAADATVAVAYPGPPSAPAVSPAASRQVADATVAVAFPGPPSAPPSPPAAWVNPAPAQPRRRSRKGLVVAVSGLVLVMLAAGTLLAYAITHQQPLLNLSSTTLSPGDTLVVTATKLPPNQAGEFQLFSQEYVFPFRADGRGQVTSDITIPYDIGAGDHALKVCWSGVCHGQASLTILGLPSPTPYTYPSPLPSATPSPTGLHSPSPQPPVLEPSRESVPLRGSLTIYGLHFPARQSVNVTLIQGTASRYLTTTTVNAQGSFGIGVTVPATAAPGQATLRACSTGGVCADASITVTA